MDPADAAARLRLATERLEARTSQLAAQRRAHEAERAKSAEKVAQERRRGEHGRDWQVLQQRFDLGQSSEFLVVQGLDASAEARAVRKMMGEQLGKLVAERERTGDEPVALTPELAEAQDRLVATLRRLRDVTRDSGIG